MSGPVARFRPTRPAGALASPRTLALAGGALLTAAYLSVLYHVVDVVGGVASTGGFLAVVLASFFLAAVCVRAFDSGWALVFALVLVGAGLVGYLLAVPRASIDVEKQFADTVALLSGMSVLRVTRAGVWALGLTPGPVFLSWYFFGRRAYAPGVLVGGAALALFALTGDVGTVTALLGVLGGAAAVGFGQLDREGPDPALRNAVVVVLVAMLVVTTSLSLVPGGDARPLLPDSGTGTVESSLTAADARVGVQGRISLSPELRFSVTAAEPSYWRVGAYDRYTGDGWVRTGETTRYRGELPAPDSSAVRPLRQTFEAESAVSTMPAAWKPVAIESAPGPVGVTDQGGLRIRGDFRPGERYTVVSMVPDRSTLRLRRAGTDYPPAIEAHYTDLPESTPERLSRFTDDLTAGADTPYEEAVAIESWLESNKAYSLDVDRPDGDVASAFVFEMDAGYCTYFATAMVAMLRTQGIPARFVAGYLPGERVAEDEWLVRGLDSHAWVEVYVPEAGWVRFDPTPADPRRATERDSLAVARAAGVPNVDANASVPRTASPSIQTTSPTDAEADDDAADTPGTPNGSATGRAPGGSVIGVSDAVSGAGGRGGPSPETVLYGVVLLLGATTAAVRLGIVGRLRRLLWLRRLPGGSPSEQIEAATERGEYLLGRRYRPRRVGETRRAYLEALAERDPNGDGIDDRAVALFRLGERARYAGRASERDAADAVRLLRGLRAKFGRLG